MYQFIKNLFYIACLFCSINIAFANNEDISKEELYPFLSQFFHALDGDGDISEFIHEDIGLYCITTEKGITIRHFLPSDVVYPPDGCLLLYHNAGDIIEDEIQLVDTLVNDCRGEEYYGSITDYCQRSSPLQGGIYVADGKTNTLLKDYIEAYAFQRIRLLSGETITFSRIAIDQGHPEYSDHSDPQPSYYESWQYKIAPDIVAQLDQIRALENNVFQIIIGLTRFEFVKRDDQWYLLAIDSFPASCSWQRLMDNLDYYQCNSNNTVN